MNRRDYLLEAFLNETATPAQVDELFRLITETEGEEALNKIINDAKHDKEIDSSWERPEVFDKIEKIREMAVESARQRQELMHQKETEKFRRRHVLMHPVLKGAAVIIFILVSYLIYTERNNNNERKVLEAISGQAGSYRKLADGTRVILEGGSQLFCPTSFTGALREVKLIGKAYFDVAPNPSQPFVINTGKLRTTVLGTSFTIEAFPQKNTTVTVTSGRVKVNDDHALNVVLTANWQLEWDNEKGRQKVTQVDSSRATGWMSMQFNEMPFSQAVAVVSARYGVHISFDKQELATCQVNSQFDGPEELSQVLDVLCMITHTTFSMNGNEVVISGKGCLPAKI